MSLEEIISSLGSAGGAAAKASPWGSVASMIPSVMQFLTGNKQAKMASQFAKTQRPAFTIPKGIYENVSLARNMASGGLPGEGFLRGRLDRVLSTTANQFTQAGRDPSSIIAGITAANTGLMDKEAELGYKGERFSCCGK